MQERKRTVMELLKLSKFKLKLQALITEVRDLRVKPPSPANLIAIATPSVSFDLLEPFQDRELSATEQHHQQIQAFHFLFFSHFLDQFSFSYVFFFGCSDFFFGSDLVCGICERDQRHKRNEEEYSRKIQELQEELASNKEERQKLERKVNCLQNDNAMLESKHKELKGTLNSVLQSRENFVHAYEESNSQMRRTVETKDRMLSVLSEKINSHLLLFDSIEKEVFFIKQIVDEVQNLVSDKEEVVNSLKNKMDHVSAFEKYLAENISDLRNKLENNEAELRRKDRLISELGAKLDEAKLSSDTQAQIEDLKRTLSVKDVEIQNLISDKEALHYEVGSLKHVLQRVQDNVTNMNEEDKRLFSCVLLHKEATATDMKIAENRSEDIVQSNEEMARREPS